MKTRRCKHGKVKSGPRKGMCRVTPKERSYGRSRRGRGFHGGSFGADFQRRHYQRVADILRLSGCKEAIRAFEVMFQDDNPRFDARRFRAAAGG